MKYFSITKIGYTSGVYGCTGEYFLVAVYNGDKEPQHCILEGLYGEDQRAAGVLQDAGYKQVYTSVPYGKLTRKDLKPYTTRYANSVIELTKLIKGTWTSPPGPFFSALISSSI